MPGYDVSLMEETMKLNLAASLLLAILCSTSASFANNDPSDQASALGACAALCSAATPIALGASAAYASEGASDALVKIVDASGKGLSELTSATFGLAIDALVYEPNAVRTTASKREIPLVVRRDYLELNEPVQANGQ